MKLAPAEAKAVKFVLLIVALSALARFARRPEPLRIDTIPTATASAVGGGRSGQKADAVRRPIDPNRATLLELDRLPGIGEATAKRIIAARPLKDLNDLAKVVGRKRAQQLAPLVTLRGPLEDRPSRESAKSRQSRAYEQGSPNDRPERDTRVAPSGRTREPVDLNRASLAELERISGVGPALARRLIMKRDSLGSFRDWSQVDAIPGVGPALLKKLKEAGTL